jgi:hypothetical protein
VSLTGGFVHRVMSSALATVLLAPAETSPADKRTLQTIAGTIVVGQVESRTLRAALEVLPRRPTRIEIIDDKAMPPDTRQQIRELDAFVVIQSDVIYLRRQSMTLRQAELSGGPFVLMLAAVIWHEMAHVEGLDETEARRREEMLWAGFVQKGLVEPAVGLAYLDELSRRFKQ